MTILQGIVWQDGKLLNVGMDIYHRDLCLLSDNKMMVEEQEKVIEIVKIFDIKNTNNIMTEIYLGI